MFSLSDFISLESWILLGTFLLLGRIYLHRKWQYLASLNIPHDPPSILRYGNFVTMCKEAFTVDLENKKRFGSIWGFYTGTKARIVVHDANILNQIMINQFANFSGKVQKANDLNGKELATNLLAISGNQWKRVRSTMIPAFSTSKLRRMAGVIEWCVDDLITNLTNKLENGEGTFVANHLFPGLSLKAICSSAFGTVLNSKQFSKRDGEILYHAERITSTFFINFITLTCLIFPFIDQFCQKMNITGVNKLHINYFIKLTTKIASERNKNLDGLLAANLIQVMLNLEITEDQVKQRLVGMTRTEIIGNSMLMILAGYETTSNSMTYLAFNLAQNLDIQNKLQIEIDEMVQSYGCFSFDAIASLKYIDMCLNESLRLYSPLVRNLRSVDKEITINGLTIPGGIDIWIPVYALNHDPEYWDEPFEYRPERMRDMSKIDPMYFQPFGAGPRSCIGMKFAILEMKMTMAKLLHKLTILPTKNTPKPPLKLKFGVLTRPAVDVQLHFTIRK